MTTEHYGVKNSQTGKLFAGFDASNAVLWTNDEAQARSFGSVIEAQAQARLFRATDIRAQSKPVGLGR